MTEAEQVLVALMLHEAENSDGKKYRGELENLRGLTERPYELEKFEGAFENALDFLLEKGFATLYQYEGVKDYVTVDISSSTKRDFIGALSSYDLEEKNFSFSNKTPTYPIISAYLDVGSKWLYDFAFALSDNPDKAMRTTDSASWTGRYVVSTESTAKIQVLLIDMQKEVEALEIPNSEKANALAAIAALNSLAAAPDPPWAIIIKLLQSPVLANLTALAALIVTIVKP